MDYKTGFTRNVDFLYRQLIDSSAIRPGVRLEMGIRGGTMPGTQVRTIKSYIAEYTESEGLRVDYDEMAPVEVNVIAPVRTLAEKLALVHHAAKLVEDGKTAQLLGAGRHYYDIRQLLENQEVIAALSAPGQAMAVLSADVDERSAEFGWDHTPRPADGYANSNAFRPTGAVREAAAAGYSAALNLVWGERPTFDQCLESIAKAHDIL